VFGSVKLKLVWVLEPPPSVAHVARFVLVWTSVRNAREGFESNQTRLAGRLQNGHVLSMRHFAFDAVGRFPLQMHGLAILGNTPGGILDLRGRRDRHFGGRETQ
jgi:hypothetical protein